MDRSTDTFVDLEMNNKIKGCKHLLLEIDKIVDWHRIREILKPTDFRNNARSGRDSFSPETMFRIMFIQECQGLSDRQMEEQLHFNFLYLHFSKLSMTSPIPDHSTICRWRDRFIKFDVFEALLNVINSRLEELGIGIRKGANIDATFVASAARPRRKEEIEVIPVDENKSSENEETQKTPPSVVKHTITESHDPDATWGVKGGRGYFGYKEMIITNTEGFISSVVSAPANIHDLKMAKECVHKAKLEEHYPICGDKAFDSNDFLLFIREKNLIDMIMRKRKRNDVNDALRGRRNKLISSVRFVVERTFGYIKYRLGGSRSRYIGLIKTHNSFLMKAMIYNLTRLIHRPIESYIQLT